MIQTDLEKIRYYSEKNEKKNWEFRSFLKNLDISEDEVDSTVHRIHDEVIKKIDCIACANCCKELSTLVISTDIKRISGWLKISEDEFINSYLKFDEEENEYCITKKPCHFLQNGKCSIYEVRPEDCRTYPHLQKDEFLSRLMGVVNNCSVCPIVFNVYDKLKMEFNFHR